MRARLRALGLWLDQRPSGWASGVGLAGGAAVGTALLWEPTPLRTGLCVGLTLAAVPLAWFARPAVREERVDPPPLSLLDMVPLPGGAFWMGSRDDDPFAFDIEKPRHKVAVEPFHIARVPTTQGQYATVTGELPGRPKGDMLPVNNVSWFDAVTFCNRLSLREGREPAYEIQGTQVRWIRRASGYRLPTEAEWEYAARAGTNTAWSFGDDEARLGDFAWYAANSNGSIQPVGTKKPNPWELHDMHGNVFEWCWDWYGPYSTSPVARGVRVSRGGSFFFLDPRYLRSANRFRDLPEDRREDFGFRCVLGSRREP